MEIVYKQRVNQDLMSDATRNLLYSIGTYKEGVAKKAETLGGILGLKLRGDQDALKYITGGYESPQKPEFPTSIVEPTMERKVEAKKFSDFMDTLTPTEFNRYLGVEGALNKKQQAELNKLTLEQEKTYKEASPYKTYDPSLGTYAPTNEGMGQVDGGYRTRGALATDIAAKPLQQRFDNLMGLKPGATQRYVEDSTNQSKTVQQTVDYNLKQKAAAEKFSFDRMMEISQRAIKYGEENPMNRKLWGETHEDTWRNVINYRNQLMRSGVSKKEANDIVDDFIVGYNAMWPQKAFDTFADREARARSSFTSVNVSPRTDRDIYVNVKELGKRGGRPFRLLTENEAASQDILNQGFRVFKVAENEAALKRLEAYVDPNTGQPVTEGKEIQYRRLLSKVASGVELTTTEQDKLAKLLAQVE